jgi:TolB protein
MVVKRQGGGVSRRQAVIAGILAILVLAAAVALLIASGHDHPARHRLLAGDSPSSTTTSSEPTTTTDLPATTTTARTAASSPRKRTTAMVSTTYTGPRGGIAFAEVTDPTADIFVMDADGTHVRHIATYKWGETSAGGMHYYGGLSGLAWNPAGDLISMSAAGKYGGGLELMRPDGTGRHTVGANLISSTCSTFSPDGQQLISDTVRWSPGDNGEWLEVVGVDGGDAHLLGGDAPAGAVDWSPDGSEIAIGGGPLTIARPDGSMVRQIPAPAGTWTNWPQWSPDGSWISFAAMRSADYGADLYKVHPDGSGMVQLTDNHDFSAFGSWSPDGTRMVFSRSVGSADGRRTTPQLWLMAADGSDQRQLTTAPGGADMPAWG